MNSLQVSRPVTNPVNPSPLHTALSYLSRGLSVIPIRSRGDVENRKRPLFAWEAYQQRVPTEDEVHQWFTRWPDANIGLVTGAVSGVWVLDLDRDAGALLRAHQIVLPHTPISRTGGGGLQVFFRHPGKVVPNGVRILVAPSKNGEKAPQADVRGDGGYVVLPPSLHGSGKRYEWEVPLETPFAEAPLSLLTLVLSRGSTLVGTTPRDPSWVVEALRGPIVEGQRNETAAQLAGHFLAKSRNGVEEVVALLSPWARSVCIPPMELQELRRTVASIARREHAKRVGDEVASPAVVFEEATEAGPVSPGVDLQFPEAAWRGLFATYRQAMREATHAPESALFAGLWAAGATSLGRRVRFYLGMDVYPNVAIAIVGDSGDGKTTGARHGVDRLRTLDTCIGVLRGSGSGEGVVDWLRERKDAHLWFAEEYSEILIRAGWDGATIKSVITNLWDCPPEYELRFKRDKRGTDPPPKLIQPTLNLLVCTTPTSFWRYLRDEDVEAGFGSRWVYLMGARRAMNPRPRRPTPELVERIERALIDLTCRPEVECVLESAAARVWDAFCAAWETEPWAPLTRVATKRVPQYVLKLAMLYAAFEDTLPRLTVDQVEAAILVGHYAARSADTLMRELKPGGFRSRLEARILEIVTETPLPAYKIKRQIGGGVSVEDVDRAMKVLERVGELVKVGETREGRTVWGHRGADYGK